MTAGVDPKFNEKILDKTREYIDKGWEGKAIPTVAGLSLYLGVSEKTIYEWLKFEDIPGTVYEGMDKFRKLLGEIKAKQESLLVEKGLKGEFNSTITKLLLISKHGHTEKSEVAITDMTHRDSLPVPQEAVDAFNEAMRKHLTKA